MGQRSQIYLRYNGNLIFANYYQWNYGERMVSRARWGIEYVKGHLDDGFEFVFRDKHYVEQMRRVFDANFDMHDVAISADIVKEWAELAPEEDFNETVFNFQDNNDGQLFIDIADGKIYYAFTDLAPERTIMDAEAYMTWDHDGEDWRTSKYIDADQKTACEANIKAISETAVLMPHDRLRDFLTGDYAPKPF